MIETSFDRSKSLQELEGIDWGEPIYDSYLVTTVYSLRHKPLNDFTIEDLRIVIGQNFSLPFLIPLALEQLEKDPLAQGDFYPGDLLLNVARSDSDYWRHHKTVLELFIPILERGIQAQATLEWYDRDIEDLKDFLRIHKQILTSNDD